MSSLYRITYSSQQYYAGFIYLLYRLVAFIYGLLSILQLFFNFLRIVLGLLSLSKVSYYYQEFFRGFTQQVF